MILGLTLFCVVLVLSALWVSSALLRDRYIDPVDSVIMYPAATAKPPVEPLASNSRYRHVTDSLADLIETKQRAYGDSVGRSSQILRLLYARPDGGGIDLQALPDLLLVVRVLDKLSRLATAGGQPDPASESPWRDIAGYAILALARSEDDK